MTDTKEELIEALNVWGRGVVPAVLCEIILFHIYIHNTGLESLISALMRQVKPNISQWFDYIISMSYQEFMQDDIDE